MIETGYVDQEEARALRVVQPDGLTSRADSQTMFGKDGMTFSDVLDIVNPLQQLPIVGTIYRSLTGETIKPASRIIGGALFGGPIGLMASALDSMVETATGKDSGANLVAMVTDGEMPEFRDHLPDGAKPPLLADASGVPLVTVTAVDTSSPGATAAPVTAQTAAPVQSAAADPVPAGIEAKPVATKAAAASPRWTLASNPALFQPASMQEQDKPMIVADAARVVQAEAAAPVSSPPPTPVLPAAAPVQQTAAVQDIAAPQPLSQPMPFDRASLPEIGPKRATMPNPGQTSQLASATGLSTKSSLPGAGVVTPASLVASLNSQAQGAPPAGGGLRPPSFNNVQPRMPAMNNLVPNQHMAVDLPPAPGKTAPATILQEASATLPPTQVTPAGAVQPPEVADAMARALDKYEALMRAKRGAGVNQNF